MLLVIESREDLAPVPADPAPRSTETALRHMGWPFPVDDRTPAPRRALPVRAVPTNVVPLKPVAPATPVYEPRKVARRAAPLFALELAEAN